MLLVSAIFTRLEQSHACKEKRYLLEEFQTYSKTEKDITTFSATFGSSASSLPQALFLNLVFLPDFSEARELFEILSPL